MYLSSRVIVTSVDGQLSSPQSISSGVPQGSVFGPLFFLLYFSSLPAAVQACTAMLFADDTLVQNTSCRILMTSQTPSYCCDIQGNVKRVNTRALSWNIRFKASKSAALIVTRAKKSVFPSGLYLNGEPVPNVPVVCHLGLTISSDLSWSEHVQSVVHKVGWKVNLLKRLAFRARLSIPVFSLLYKCLVRACLEYASPVWNGCSTADSHS